MDNLPLPLQTAYADLIQRCLDASFDDLFHESGRFVRRERNGRAYWYFDSAARNAEEKPIRRSRYIGPADDQELTQRVERFGAIRASALERRRIVASLRGAGLPTPTGLVGDIVAALAQAGLFRLRGTLVGTMAFQTYAGLLGVMLPGASVTTTDADFAQFHSISVCVEDSLPPIVDVLRRVDRSFDAVLNVRSKTAATAFMNASGFKVEFLTPNRGSNENQGQPAPMPALGGASAEPLRYLDFLIYAPVRAVLLHGSGVLVNVPAPERYAVHKLILATLRRADANGRAKSAKDAVQAGLLLEAIALERRLGDVGAAWMEAWGRGPKWRDALAAGRSRLADRPRGLLADGVRAACEEERVERGAFGF